MICLLFVGGFASYILPAKVSAAAASTLNFQTKIVNKTTGLNVTNGSPSCVAGGADTCDFRFSIYSDPSGGTLLWRETYSNVEIGSNNGILNESLNSICGSWTAPGGSCSGAGLVWGSDPTVYLQLDWDTDGNGDFVSPETFARQLISASAYAYFADVAGSANALVNGLDTAYTSDSDQTLDVNNVAGLTFNSSVAGNINFNLGSTGDLTVQDNGSTFLTIDDQGGLAYVLDATDNPSFVITNLGTNGSFRVNDQSGDTTPFLIDDAGKVAIGQTGPTALLDIAAATTGNASLRLRSSGGTDPSAPNSGDLWWNGTNLNFYNGTSPIDLLANASGTFVNFTPGTTQSTSSTNSIIDVTTTGNVATSLIKVNENGAGTPTLLDLQVGGSSLFTVSNAGAVTAVGVNSGTGLIQGTGGITATGTINLNNNAAANTTNIGTGTTTGAVTIGGTGTQTIAVGNGAGVKTVALGSTNTTSTTNINSGSGAVNINASNNQPTNIGTGTTTGTVTLGGTGTQTISVGNGAGVKTVNLGSSTTTSTTTLLSGSGGLLLNNNNNQPTSIGTGTTTGTVTIGGTGTQTIAVGNGAGVKTVALGSTNTTSTTTINAGTGGLTLDAVTGNINIGTSANARTINLGTGTAADTINIGNGGTTADTINIGNSATANTLVVGSTASSLTINSSGLLVDSTGNTTVQSLAVKAGGGFTTTFNAGTQAADITYTLPTSSANGVLRNTAGTLTWDTSTYLTSAITSLNGLTGATQTFATGTSGTDFNISSVGTTHTFNIPTASASNRGLLSTTDWTTFNNKQAALTFSTGLTNTSNTITNNVSTGVSGGQTIYGGTSASDGLTIDSTTNATKGTIAINPTGGTVAIANGTAAQTVSIATGAGVKTVAVGSTNSTSTTTINAGTGGLTLDAGTGNINIGNSANAKTINLGTSTAADTINIGNGGTTADTINIGNSATANTLVLGSTASSLTINSSGILVDSTGNTTVNTLKVKDGGSFTTTFQGTTQAGNITYTLPASSTNGVLTNTAGVLTWGAGSSGITSLNGLSGSSQTFATGTSGTDFNISSSGTIHTFNIPTASATNRGLLSTTDWTTFNNKQAALTFSTGLTNTSNTITNNLSTGVSGGQTAYGGTAASDGLTLDSTTNATKGTIAINPTGGTVAIANGTATQTVQIGTGAGAKTITVGSTNTTSTTTINSGSGGVLINDSNNQPISIGTGTSTGTITLGGTGAQTISIGNGAGAKTLNLGSSNTTSATNLLSGSAGLNLNVSNNQPTNINTGTSTGTINLGNNGGQVIVNSSTWDITGAGVASGLTGITSSGTITLSTLNVAGGFVRTSGTGVLSTSALVAADVSGFGFIQNGNSFGATGTLGTNDAQNLAFETNNITRAYFDTSGNLNFDSQHSVSNTVYSKILFTNTAGTGDFAIGADGGDIFWQGGGTRNLQMGAYWGMDLIGHRQSAGFPTFVVGGDNYNTRVYNELNDTVGLIVQGFSTQTSDLLQIKNNAGTVLDGITGAGNVFFGATAGTTDQLYVAKTAAATSTNAQQIDYTQGANAANITGAGLVINATGSGQAGDTLYGMQFGNFTGTAATETALQFGTGWDKDINFTDSTVDIGVADNSEVNIVNASGANLMTMRDYNNNFGATFSAGAFIDRNSALIEDFNKFRTVLNADTTGAAGAAHGDGGGWGAYENTNCTFSTLADTVNGIERIQANATGSGCMLGIDEALNNARLNFRVANLPIILMKFSITSTNANNRTFVGLSTTTDGATTDPAEFIGFTDNGGTTWTARTTTGGTSTNITCTGQTTSTTQYALGMIEVRSSTDIHFFMDGDVSNGVQFTECGTGSSTNIPAGNLGAQLQYQARVGGTANQALLVDFFRAWQDDNTPRSATPVNVAALAANYSDNSSVAQFFPSDDLNTPAGTLVTLDKASSTLKVKPSETAYDENTVGVVVSRALDIGNGSFDGIRVSIAGRTSVFATNENGEIQPGDYLTSGSVAGSVMKATKAGYVIGQALTGIINGQVVISIKPAYYNGVALQSIADGLTQDVSLTAEELVAPKSLHADLGENLLAVFAQNKQTVNTMKSSEIFTDRVAAAIEIITPKVLADQIFTNDIIARANDLSITIGDDGKLIIRSKTGDQPLAIIDSQGNATFTGTVTADKLQANQIQGLELLVNNLKSQIQSGQVAGLSTTNGASLSQVTISSAKITLDLNVLGQLNAEGGLVVAGSARFQGDTQFNGNTEFTRSPMFSKDSGGYAVIKKDADSVEVKYSQPITQVPLVVANISSATPTTSGTVLAEDIKYVITEQSGTGFTIKLNKPAAFDIKFTWMALVVKDPTTTESKPVVVPQAPVTPDPVTPDPTTTDNTTPDTTGSEPTDPVNPPTDPVQP